jgi:hypothetical protein
MRGVLGRASKVYQRPPKISLEPGAEIHGEVFRGHTDIPEIAGAIARQNVHAAAERDGEVGEVAAHPSPFFECVKGCPRHARVLIAERDLLMHEVADRLHQRVALRKGPEPRAGKLRQPVGLAITATEKIDERLDGEFLERVVDDVRAISSGLPLSSIRKSEKGETSALFEGFSTVRLNFFMGPSQLPPTNTYFNSVPANMPVEDCFNAACAALAKDWSMQ